MEKECHLYRCIHRRRIERRPESRGVVTRLVKICRIDSLNITGVEREVNAPVVNKVYRGVALFTCGSLPFAKAGKLSLPFICAFCIVGDLIMICIRTTPKFQGSRLVE